MSGDDNVVELQNPRRMTATAKDVEAVGGVLDHLKKEWEKGNVGTIVFAYLSLDRGTIKTDHVKMPGSSVLELVGMCEQLADKIKENYK